MLFDSLGRKSQEYRAHKNCPALAIGRIAADRKGRALGIIGTDTWDLHPRLSNVVPPALESATSKSVSEGRTADRYLPRLRFGLRWNVPRRTGRAYQGRTAEGRGFITALPP